MGLLNKSHKLLKVLTIMICTAVAVTPAVADAQARWTPTMAHDLRWAVDLKVEQAGSLSNADLFEAGEWLWLWQMIGPKADFAGTDTEFIAASRKGAIFMKELIRRQPNHPHAHWMLARLHYVEGEMLPEDAKDERLKLYDAMIEHARYCVEKVNPKEGNCWHFLATGIGRRGTTKGVLNSLFSAEEIEEVWQKAYALDSTYVASNGDTARNNARYGLGVFYRLLPDSWLVKLVAGTRGDIDKSVKSFTEAVADQPNRLELHKELAVALLCKAERDDDEAAKKKGLAVAQTILDGKFDASDVRGTDAMDKSHVKELLKKPEAACGYSRDGYEDVSEDAVKNVKK